MRQQFAKGTNICRLRVALESWLRNCRMPVKLCLTEWRYILSEDAIPTQTCLGNMPNIEERGAAFPVRRTVSGESFPCRSLWLGLLATIGTVRERNVVSVIARRESGACLFLKKHCWKYFWRCQESNGTDVRFEVFTAVTMKNGVFRYVTPCGSCNNRRLRGP
jgi:hypothetical protein